MDQLQDCQYLAAYTTDLRYDFLLATQSKFLQHWRLFHRYKL